MSTPESRPAIRTATPAASIVTSATRVARPVRRSAIGAISDSSHGPDRASVTKFGAELSDVHVDGPRSGGGLVAPHFGEQMFAREHPAGASAQEDQQLEFGGRQINRNAVGHNPAPSWIDADAADDVHPLVRAGISGTTT